MWRIAAHESPLMTADPFEGTGQWFPFEGPLMEVPRGRRSLYEVYGDPGVTYTRTGKVKVSARFERQNLVVARGLPGVPGGKLYVHRLVEPYLREALRRCAIAAPHYQIDKIGCFAPRHQRHDRSRPLSDHTWAVAVDINPDRNRPHTDGDMPPEFVEAWESLGWEWGGRWETFRDPMHFSYRRT